MKKKEGEEHAQNFFNLKKIGYTIILIIKKRGFAQNFDDENRLYLVVLNKSYFFVTKFNDNIRWTFFIFFEIVLRLFFIYITTY